MAETRDRADSAVDVDVEGLDSPPPKEKRTRASSSMPGVYNVNDLETEGVEIEVAPEIQRTGWKINTSSSTVEDAEILKLRLAKPPVKKIDLAFVLGMEVTARNMRGVTIKDALDAIHKAFKKKSDEELERPSLADIVCDKEESWTRLVVHLQKGPAMGSPLGRKKNRLEREEEE